MLRQRFLLIYALVALGLVANAAPSQPLAKDLHGDPLPAGAVARLGADRWQHGSSTFAAFLPDGKQVVTVSPDRTIRVWEFPSGKEIKRITPPEPDGAAFRSPGAPGAGGQVALSKDGKTIALGGREIYLCDLTTGKELARLKWVSKSILSPGSAVARLAFSPDGEHLASITGEGTIRIWDWAKAKEVRSFGGVNYGASQLVYAPGGKSIATRGPSGKQIAPGPKGPPVLPGPDVVKLWDLATGKEIWSLRTDAGRGADTLVAFSRDGKTLALAGSAFGNNAITLVEAATGKEIGTLAKDKEGSNLSSLVFAKDGTKLYATNQSVLMEWDIASGKLLRQCATPYATGISLSPDGNTLVVAGSLEFLDLAGGKDITVRTGAATALYSLQFTPDGKNLLTTRGVRLGGESVQKWDAVTGKDLGPVSLPLPLDGIELSPDGKVLAGRKIHADDPFNRKGPFVLVDAASGKELGQITPGAAAGQLLGMNISFSPNGTILAIGSGFGFAKDGKVELYDVPAAKPRHTLDAKPNYYGELPMAFFSPDSKTFASYADEKTLTLGLWDTTTGRRIGSLSLPKSNLGATLNDAHKGAFTPDGR
jgi:WD40 repeat protein